MKRRAIRMLILLWLGWYVSGPAFEAFDFWDSPQEEISDVLRSAGGLVTLVGVIVCFGISLFRKLRASWLTRARSVRDHAAHFVLPSIKLPSIAAATIAHSPPFSLRI